jgi:hypothetical protein
VICFQNVIFADWMQFMSTIGKKQRFREKKKHFAIVENKGIGRIGKINFSG